LDSHFIDERSHSPDVK